jgi:hypothetical protein
VAVVKVQEEVDFTVVLAGRNIKVDKEVEAEVDPAITEGVLEEIPRA